MSAPIPAASMEVRVTPSTSVAGKTTTAAPMKAAGRSAAAPTRVKHGLNAALVCERVQLAREGRLRGFARQYETNVVEALALDKRRCFDERLLPAAGRESRGHQNDPLMRRDAPGRTNVGHAAPAHPFRLKF